MNAKLGPLTARIISAAGWSDPNCPSDQNWADEFERVFEYANAKGQLTGYRNRLTSERYGQFDSALRELRVAYYLDQMGFPVLTWEPIPQSGNAGEFLVNCPAGRPIFVEVKSPGWESELTDAERKAGRAKQEKYQDMDARWVASHKAIQFAIRKAYKKFDPACPNLLVIADDLFVGLQNTPKFAKWALYDAGGYFTNSGYEKLGGVGIFWVNQNVETWGYKIELFLNDYVLASAAIPPQMVSRLAPKLAYASVAKG